ncbi:MAG: hypothetical protein D3903_11100 [Candidatus Electrothrix sp. GM3_4]|nr:hypothetical protein [Candidatus Electrothrix sp. GM3_4]
MFFGEGFWWEKLNSVGGNPPFKERRMWLFSLIGVCPLITLIKSDPIDFLHQGMGLLRQQKYGQPAVAQCKLSQFTKSM